MKLLDFRSNYTSQCGQDGVLAKVFDVLGIRSGYCVEFGAWDGLYLSNTRQWLQSPQFSGCLIEGDHVRFQALKKLYGTRTDVHTINTFVSIDGENSLDSILQRVGAPVDFDLLSIDIDCDDYHIWSSLQHFKPKLVLIETNPYIPFYVEYVQKKNLGRYPIGASVVSMYKLAIAKGYQPICYIGHDWLCLRKDLLPAFDLDTMACIPMFLAGSDVRNNDLMAHGNIIPLPTGPASERQVNINDIVYRGIAPSFEEFAQEFRVLTSPSDFASLL